MKCIFIGIEDYCRNLGSSLDRPHMNYEKIVLLSKMGFNGYISFFTSSAAEFQENENKKELT